jgi:hypothetical protein
VAMAAFKATQNIQFREEVASFLDELNVLTKVKATVISWTVMDGVGCWHACSCGWQALCDTL